MTPDQFRTALEAAGLSYAAASRLFGHDERTVRKWAMGEAAMAPTAAILVRLLESGKITVVDIAEAGSDGDRRTRRD